MANARNRWSIEQAILEQAAANAGELRKLANDPKGTLEQALGESLPPGVEVRVAFDLEDKIHQVLPFAGHAFLGAIEPPEGKQAIPGLRGLSVATAHRAATDEAFCKALCEDPAGLARTHLSKLELSEAMRVEVVQEDATTVWLTMPLNGRGALRKRLVKRAEKKAARKAEREAKRAEKRAARKAERRAAREAARGDQPAAPPVEQIPAEHQG